MPLSPFRTGKIAVLTPHLVPPIRPDYFRFHTRNFESGLTPHLVPPIGRTACTKQLGRGAARRVALGRNFRLFLQNFMYGIFYFFINFFIIFFLCANAAVAVALYVFRELRLAAYRDRIAAACTVCTSCYAKYRVRTACTSSMLTGDQGDKMKNNVLISESV